MRVVEIAEIVEKVPVHSVNPVYRCEDGEGRTWAVKDCPNSGAFADALGLSLGSLLGLRCPEPGIVRLRGAAREDSRLRDGMLAVAWVPDATHWLPTIPMSNPSEIGEVMALDTILGVSDRHERNLLLRFEEQASTAVLWVIDFDNAMIASPDRLGMNPVQLQELEGVDQDAVRVGADILLRRVEALFVTRAATSSGERLLAEVVQNVVALGRGIQADDVRDLLYARCANARGLVASSLLR